MTSFLVTVIASTLGAYIAAKFALNNLHQQKNIEHKEKMFLALNEEIYNLLTRCYEMEDDITSGNKRANGFEIQNRIVNINNIMTYHYLYVTNELYAEINTLIDALNHDTYSFCMNDVKMAKEIASVFQLKFKKIAQRELNINQPSIYDWFKKYSIRL